MASLAELQAELAEVNQALRDQHLGGAEYGLSDRRFKGVNYADLQKRRRELSNAIAFASGRPPVSCAHTDVSSPD